MMQLRIYRNGQVLTLQRLNIVVYKKGGNELQSPITKGLTLGILTDHCTEVG